MIRIYCSKADATLQETETLTAGMVNTPVVQFTFSSDWNGLGKSAIVRAGTVIKEVVVTNNQIVVPSECLAKAGVNLIIGVWGGNFTTELPTVWCACGEIQDATNPYSALNHEEGTPSNVAQMLAAAERAEAALDSVQNIIDQAEAIEDQIEAILDIVPEHIDDNSEAWAVGKRFGADVSDDDQTYHNNSKYYASQAGASASQAVTAKNGIVAAQATVQNLKDAAETARDEAVSAAANAYDSVMSSAVPDAVTTWLAANMTNPSNPAIDESLLVSGAAADSASTGTAIKSIVDSIGCFATGDVNANTILFTANDVSIGDTVYYDITAYDGYTGLISLYDSTPNRLMYVGKRSRTSSENHYSGSFKVPEDFSYAIPTVDGASGTTGKMRINWLSLKLKPAVELDNIKSLEAVNWRKDMFDATQIKTGYALMYSDGSESAMTGFGITDYIPVFPGCKVSKTWNLGSNTYGTVFYAADKETIISIIPENLYSGDIIAPDGAYYFRTNVSPSYLDQIHIYVTPPQHDTINDINNYEVTKTGELVGGFAYSAFPVITQFNGVEVIAFRSASQHFTDLNLYGGTAFYIVNQDGTVEFKRFITDSEPEFVGKYNGEFRIEGLSVTPDGERLFVSGFASLNDLPESGDTNVFSNIIYELDSNFNIVAVNVLGQSVSYVLTGKVLTTPDGYLVNAGHSGNQTRVVMFKSDQVYNNNLSELTFSMSTITTGTSISESDFGFVNGKLTCISRVHDQPSVLMFSNSAEGGNGTWSQQYQLGSPLHMPKILECTHGDYLVYGGARYISASVRKPVIGVYDVTNKKVIQESVIWDGHECYGYYLDFVKYSDYIFDVVFYVDKLARDSTLSKIMYKRINIREFCPAINKLV